MVFFKYKDISTTNEERDIEKRQKIIDDHINASGNNTAACSQEGTRA